MCHPKMSEESWEVLNDIELFAVDCLVFTRVEIRKEGLIFDDCAEDRLVYRKVSVGR